MCRKVGNGTSQLAVHYQALKQKAIQTQYAYKELKEKFDLSQQLRDLKQSIDDSSKSTPLPIW